MGGAAFYYRPAVIQEIRDGYHPVIEAGAGTGKTFAIEHLVLDLLLSGECEIDQILVMTFTEKATVELRVRIRQALENLLVGAPVEDPGGAERIVIDQSMRKSIEQAFHGFDRAQISTIHGFCHRVLTDFPFQAGTPLDLKVTDSRGAFHRAFRAELRENLALREATRKLLQDWLMGTGPDELKGKTAGDLETLLWDAHRRRYLESSDFGSRQEAAAGLIKKFDGRLLRQAYQGSGLNEKYLTGALAAIEGLEKLIKQARRHGEQLLELLAHFECKPLTDPARRTGKFKNVSLSSAVLEVVQQLKAADTAAKSWHWKLVDLFLPPIAERLQRDKREQGLIDYDDMLGWVSRALSGERGPALAAALRERFRVALVDEFQDTDDLQWRIFRSLFVGSASNRLYVVGDPKQAIYAFRGADVFTYLAARRELTGTTAPVQLSHNYRSTKDLIEACNHIFDQTVPEPIFKGEILYDNPARCGRPRRKALDSKGNPITPVVLMRYQTAKGKASFAEVRTAIGRHLAAQLRGILKRDKDRIRIQDKGEASQRTVGAKDIFVLTRTRQESAEIGDYLREAGVPFAFYKQEGLFQTSEAGYVLDVLRAVAEPQIRSNRLKAWVSPFFAIPLRELALIDEVAPSHPMNEQLYQWKGIAERGQFAELFERLLHDSGLTARELFLEGSERQITNYQHIFELLLTAALARRLDLAEIIRLLEDYITERATPDVEEPNIQRLESEHDAVSVITVHMSKGLEADVVALFGGFGRINDLSGVVVYHDQGERRFAIGKVAKEFVKDKLKEEQEAENSRLLYVGLTRAAARLYLPLLPEKSTKIDPSGYYAAMNRRLLAIEPEADRKQWSNIFTVQKVAPPAQTGVQEGTSKKVKHWTPPVQSDPKDLPSEGSFWELRRGHAALMMRSYTSLRGSQEEPRWDIPAEEFKRDLDQLDEERDEPDLPGGREAGIFLHEVIEKLPMDSFAQSPDHRGWRQREDIGAIVRAAMRRHQVKEPWFERGIQMVFNALTAPIVVGGRVVGPLHQCPSVREMEFVYPIPEASHPLLATSGQGEWTVRRGYMKGFVDFVFERDGLVYFADWKSDQLPAYEGAAIDAHVMKHYAIQARIYSIGIVRLLQIRTRDDYERRFGGLLYIFLRGLDGGGERGIYFHRPPWSEICDYESALMRLESSDG